MLAKVIHAADRDTLSRRKEKEEEEKRMKKRRRERKTDYLRVTDGHASTKTDRHMDGRRTGIFLLLSLFLSSFISFFH